MAFADTETNRIYGAKKGSLVYYHEVGHLIFSRRTKGVKIRAKAELSKDMLLITLGLFVFFGGVLIQLLTFWFLARWLYYFSYEEFACWVYAFEKRRLKLGSQKI